ncbi:MAG: twin-arginine translocation signal domain-containing protein [Planctomycetota bacterium]
MDRREFLKNFGLGAASVALAGCGGSPLVKTIGRNRPNIVLILCDDMGYSDISCYGGEIDTPNLDLPVLQRRSLLSDPRESADRSLPTRVWRG